MARTLEDIVVDIRSVIFDPVPNIWEIHRRVCKLVEEAEKSGLMPLDPEYEAELAAVKEKENGKA